jgi:caffeoyl-CoA O-methyltransferase
MTEALNDYVSSLFVHEDDALRSVRIQTSEKGLPQIELKPFEGRLLQMLVRMSGGRRCVEVGTLAGYSGSWMARGLAPGGRLWTLEVSAKHAGVAREHFQMLGLADRVEVVLGRANEVFAKVEPHGPFDLVFIDADKPSYIDYLDWAGKHLRPGGIVAAHNAIAAGGVLDPKNDHDRALDRFNRALSHDTRFDATILTIGDGMAVGVRK